MGQAGDSWQFTKGLKVVDLTLLTVKPTPSFENDVTVRVLVSLNLTHPPAH